MKNRKVAVWAAAAIIFGLTACSGGGASTSSDTAKPAPAEVAPAEETAPEPAAEPEWTTIATITGNTDQQSDTISLSGGKVRLSYDFAGGDMMMAAIYVLTEGTDLTKDGGFPEVTVTEAGAGETILRKSAGDYFLRVMAANTDYTVTLEEMK